METPTHILGPVLEKPASGCGDIDGWSIACSCGERASFSIRSMVVDHGEAHLAYFARKGHKVGV